MWQLLISGVAEQQIPAAVLLPVLKRRTRALPLAMPDSTVCADDMHDGTEAIGEEEAGPTQGEIAALHCPQFPKAAFASVSDEQCVRATSVLLPN